MNFHDPFEHNEYINHIYIVENIPTDDTEELFQEIFIEGCNCKNECRIESCSCLKKYGKNYIITRKEGESSGNNLKNFNYSLNSNKLNRGLYECNISCKCANKLCGNKLVQLGPCHTLEIRDCSVGTLSKGKGLFTNKKILKGNFICEYAGEIITKAEALKRFENNEKNNLMNYILCVKEHFGPSENTTFIDPTFFGNIGRYINHSCNPNCELIPVRVNNTIPKLCIFAKKDIDENTEITFDYGEGKTMVSDIRFNLKPCLCGQETCRKWLPFLPEICN